jgi:hypothetical protein
MPNYGSLVLSDLAAHYLALVHEPCRRRGHLNVTLLDKQGDDKLTEHAAALANYEKARAFRLYDRCKTRYGLCP